MRKRRFVLFLGLSVICGYVFSLSVSDLVGERESALLRSDTSANSMSVNSTKLQLVPKADSGAVIEKKIAQFSPSVIVEAVYLYKKTAGFVGRSWTDDERVQVYNVLRSLSTLSGIEYYSASRGHMRVLYEKSYIVDGLTGKDAQSDPVVDRIPEEAVLFAVQKDLTFGENRYKYEYAASPRDFSFSQSNMTTMNYGILPLIGKEGLKTIVLVCDTDEGYVLYAVSAVKAMLLPGIDEKIKASFSNRADAIFRWFSTRMDSVLSVKR